jgi:hypothetical protein
MQLVDKKKKVIMIASIILGLGFSSYLIYEQEGQFGKSEIISIIGGALIAILIVMLVIRRANK